MTDKATRERVATREIMSEVEHRQDKRLNDQAELSHQLTRTEERQRRRLPLMHSVYPGLGWKALLGCDVTESG